MYDKQFQTSDLVSNKCIRIYAELSQIEPILFNHDQKTSKKYI